MGIRLTNTSIATYDTSVTVEIHDKDGGDDNFTFDILSPGYTIEFLGDKSNIFDNIITSNARCNLIINSDETQDFFDDLVGGNEGRFYVRILVNDAIVFIGKIIQDNITLEDTAEPQLTFTAIDTITDLKSKDFNMDLTPFSFLRVKDIFTYIFNQMPVEWLYPSSGPLWGFQSDIVPNVVSYSGNLMAIMSVPNYFYEDKNREQVRWNCYDVLDEMLKRMNCSLRSIYGIHWITGLEGIHNTRATQLHYYDVDGDYVASSAVSTTSLNITNGALAGGVYNYQSGYKRLIWEADKEYSDRGFGVGIYWQLNYPTAVIPLEQVIGVTTANLAYKLKINVNIQSVELIDPAIVYEEFFYILLTITEKRISTGADTVLFTDEPILVPTVPGDYIFDFPLFTRAYDCELRMSVSHQQFYAAYNIDDIVFNVNANLSESAQTYQSIKVISTINDSTNPGIREIKTKGNQHNGNELVRFVYYTLYGTDPLQLTKEYKFSGGSSWIPYEQLITESQLKRLGNTHILEIPYNDFFYHDNFHNIVYKGINYYIIGLVHNLHQDTTNFILFKKNGVQDGTITTIEEVPYDIDVNNTVSTIIGNYRLLARGNYYYEDFENVTDQFVTVDTDLNDLFGIYTEDEVKLRSEIYLNGVKMKYVDPSALTYPYSVGDIEPNEWTVSADNDEIWFGYELQGDYVEFKHNDI